MIRNSAMVIGLMTIALSNVVYAENSKKILFLAGRPSHGYGSHEHLAGCRILAEAIERSTGSEIECVVVGNGWPEDENVLEDADTIVMYCDGGGGHPAIRHLPKLAELMKKGVGFVCLHYAVEVPIDRGGAEFLDWLGGYFETHWSVNPHWIADYQSLPNHPVTRGVKPFQANDEWYFHMRFRPEMNGVTPILSAVAPVHTMIRPDGPHSGNPTVRKAVAEGVPQHTAWTFERPDGGRSFGFTGGHFHWNWGREEILRLVCNAIVWTAKSEIPATGLAVTRQPVEKLEQGQDEPIPTDHQRQKILEEFKLLSQTSSDDLSKNLKQPTERDPRKAVAGFKVAQGLEVTLAASEPMIRSLTNLDIDHRGRIWVCEVVNYRNHLGKRPEGDRILILEDTDGDGVVDSDKTFYQGSDIDSAMGICVLGDKVIVSASPNIWLFTDHDGDDVPDKKELLFSKTGQPQHDHSAHSFIFGPDGKLYWNFGNTGKAVHDAEGKIVTDTAGNEVKDNGKPYLGGMVFRCNLDGSEFETLAHNFRNNYEVTVDSFGTLWQTDNDDDGNKATRVNYVMEYGNYGYRDELTGAGWQSQRSNIESSIPEQHWHLNDPGVVPTMLITGAGSPSAATFYEGVHLPERFRNRMIHCEPGLNVVRAYPHVADGAGYRATVENLLEAVDDNWFRPVDVCPAPDGSLFVTDWYDPGVGGHAMGDLACGRLLRVAAQGSRYEIPPLSLSGPEQATAALVSANQATRYLAWKALQRFGSSAQPALEKLSIDRNASHRARAYWALGKIVGNGKSAVASALSDEDPLVRCMGVRLARQLKLATSDYFLKVLGDPSPAVRRELAIALRLDNSSDMPGFWAALAASYQGGDRWLLEALGVGAERRWDECLRAYAEKMKQQGLPPHFDLIWRARTAEADPFLIEHFSREDLSLGDANRLLRSLDYHSAESRSRIVESCLGILMNQEKLSSSGQYLAVEFLLKHPPAQSAAYRFPLEPILESELAVADRRKQLEMLTQLPIVRSEERLLDLASKPPIDSIAAGAAEKLVGKLQPRETWDRVRGLDEERQISFVQAVSAAAPTISVSCLRHVMEDEAISSAVRVEVAKGLTRTLGGSKDLLSLAETGRLTPELRTIVGSILRSSTHETVKQKAHELFPPPRGRSSEEFPPLNQLVSMTGDAVKGSDVFRTVGTCIKCHPMSSDVRPIGPDLSEIGNKLAKEALYVAILDPSAGISHNYESYSALTEDGQLLTGLLVSQTEDTVVLRDAEGIDRELNRAELESFQKLPSSLMPANLIEQLSTKDLVNLVEYLQTLRKQG